MTHEEANKLFDKIFRHEFINGSGHMVAPKHKAWELVDKIYDSIENKTCENCKFYYKGECIVINDWDCWNDEPCNWTPPDNFGCNKFEPKEM